MMSARISIKSVFEKDNLALAWERLILNQDPLYKNYFRDNIKTYSLALEKNLFRLSTMLQKGTWEPTEPSLVYFPKKSGLLRKYCLLTIEDQIVYQAIANIVSLRIGPKLSQFYNKKTFGYQLDSRPKGMFYIDYKKSFSSFNRAIVSSFHRGNNYVTSFDLASFYDSIDHHVLKQSLEQFKIPPEICDFLDRLLKKWTESEIKSSVYYQGHGIPQGPLSSPFFAEVLLYRFDRLFEKESKIIYLRYVDDIRLMSKNEIFVKKDLIRLDFVSKALGLFPQSAKTKVYKISNITDEIKTITDILVFDPEDPAEQKDVFENIVKISPRLKVQNEQKLKYLLGQAKPSSKLNNRVINLLIGHPHLYQMFINYLGKTKMLNYAQSKKLLDFIYRDDLYYSVISQIIDFLRLHSTKRFKNELAKFCIKRQNGKGKSYGELVAALTVVRLESGNLTWKELNKIIERTRDWWSIAKIIRFIEPDQYGPGSVDNLLYKLMKSIKGEVALASGDKFIDEDFMLGTRSKSLLSEKAQILLKEFNKIKRVRNNYCFLKKCFDELIMEKPTTFVWKTFLGSHYDKALGSMQRWKAYVRTDPTAWINHTDVLMDFMLDQLHVKDSAIGKYQLGHIGSVLNKPTGRLATSYPRIYAASNFIHELRYQSDLSHPLIKKTKKYTRFITYKESKKARNLLKQAFVELNLKGHI